ncbi:hypothetical protein IC611_13170 [Proteus mirabilis]
MTLGAAAIAGQALGGLLISLNIFGLAWRTIFDKSFYWCDRIIFFALSYPK